MSHIHKSVIKREPKRALLNCLYKELVKVSSKMEAALPRKLYTLLTLLVLYTLLAMAYIF